MAVAVVWPPLCLIVVALRFFTRKRQNARLLIDDWLTIPAVVCIIYLNFMRVEQADAIIHS